MPELFTVSAQLWPGLAKLVEEAGELLQVAGKLMAYPYDSFHPDGTNLHTRLQEELADLQAAINFVVNHNRLLIDDRVKHKMQRLEHWRKEGR